MTTTAHPLTGTLTHAVSVMVRNSRAGDGITLATRVLEAGMTYRSLGSGPIMYVFLAADTHQDALHQVAQLLHDGAGDTVAVYTAAQAAPHVTIDPTLLAA